jgi:hypothetical protein
MRTFFGVASCSVHLCLAAWPHFISILMDALGAKMRNSETCNDLATEHEGLIN